MLKFRSLFAFDNFLQNTLGPIYRKFGQSLIQQGNELQGPMSSDDRLVRSLTQVRINEQSPAIEKASFVAPNSVILGSVYLDDNSSVWYGATLRGDQSIIQVGRNSMIQDNTSLIGTIVKKNVYVGPNATLGKCIIESDAFIGMGSVISDGAVVSGIIAAGSFVGNNQNVEAGQVWAGSPAKYLRDITPEEIQILMEHKQEISDLALIHAEENNKNFREILDDRDETMRKQYLSPEQAAYEQLAKINFPLDGDDEEFIEHRVFLKERPYYDETDISQKEMGPYEQDLENYPENFQLQKEDYEIYEKAKRFFEENPQAQAQTLNTQQQYDNLKQDQPWKNKYL